MQVQSFANPPYANAKMVAELMKERGTVAVRMIYSAKNEDFYWHVDPDALNIMGTTMADRFAKAMHERVPLGEVEIIEKNGAVTDIFARHDALPDLPAMLAKLREKLGLDAAFQIASLAAADLKDMSRTLEDAGLAAREDFGHDPKTFQLLAELGHESPLDIKLDELEAAKDVTITPKVDDGDPRLQ